MIKLFRLLKHNFAEQNQRSIRPLVEIAPERRDGKNKNYKFD